MALKLGKLAADRDSRNLKLLRLLPKGLPPLPREWDVDFDRSQDVWPLPLPMFANDQWGCCVIAGRANYTLRAEKLEQGHVLPITDGDVLNEYWREQGGDNRSKPDEGLSVLASLKSWRAEGWQAAGQHYNIYAFAEIDRHQREQMKGGIYLLNGLMVGVDLYQADMDAINQKRAWDVTNARGDLLGGHLMFAIGYTSGGVVFLTWGQRQFATWEWLLDRADEVYGVVDNRDNFLGDKSPLDIDRMDGFLKEVAAK